MKPIWALYCDRRLVEPLCGGVAVALGLMPGEALLNDVNIHLINFFRWISKGLTLQLPMNNDKNLYYRYRHRFNELIRERRHETREAAELFYYLNRTCYNGLCRFNKKGEFNVPFGSYKKINYYRDFNPYHDLFQRWKFQSLDFEEINLRPDDFLYADPPYDVEFTQYSKDGFNWDDQVRLANWLASHPGPVVSSNQATDRIVELYRGLDFELKMLNAPRLISCTGNREPAREILATKNICI